MFTKLDPFVISFCPQNNPFFVQLSAISSAKLIIMIKTKLLINPAKYSRCICPEMARYSILINVPQHKLRTLRASLCRHCASHTDASPNLTSYIECLKCLHTAYFVCIRRRSRQMTHTGRRDAQSGQMTRTPFLGCTEATRVATHKTTFCRRPR